MLSSGGPFAAFNGEHAHAFFASVCFRSCLLLVMAWFIQCLLKHGPADSYVGVSASSAQDWIYTSTQFQCLHTPVLVLEV